jgi:hypothetical protein
VVMDARKDRARRRDIVLSIEAGRIPSKSLGFLLLHHSSKAPLDLILGFVL